MIVIMRPPLLLRTCAGGISHLNMFSTLLLFSGILCVPLTTAHIALDRFFTDGVSFGADITSPTHSCAFPSVNTPANSLIVGSSSYSVMCCDIASILLTFSHCTRP